MALFLVEARFLAQPSRRLERVERHRHIAFPILPCRIVALAGTTHPHSVRSRRSLLAPARVDYPSSDGQPIAETDHQRTPLTYAVEALRHHFRDRPDVYVSGNLFIYYEEGKPHAVVVLEITSRSTRREDQVNKRERQRERQARQEAEARLARETAARKAAEARVAELEARLRQTGGSDPAGG